MVFAEVFFFVPLTSALKSVLKSSTLRTHEPPCFFFSVNCTVYSPPGRSFIPFRQFILVSTYADVANLTFFRVRSIPLCPTPVGPVFDLVVTLFYSSSPLFLPGFLMRRALFWIFLPLFQPHDPPPLSQPFRCSWQYSCLGERMTPDTD